MIMITNGDQAVYRLKRPSPVALQGGVLSALSLPSSGLTKALNAANLLVSGLCALAAFQPDHSAVLRSVASALFILLTLSRPFTLMRPARLDMGDGRRVRAEPVPQWIAGEAATFFCAAALVASAWLGQAGVNDAVTILFIAGALALTLWATVQTLRTKQPL